MKFWLVRHAQPLVDKDVCYGASDVPCDPEAVEVVAKQLLNELPLGVTIISSPLQRCEHLAQVLCRLEPSFSYKTDAALAEMNFGDWELRPWSEIPELEIRAWTGDFSHYRCGGSGESTAQFVQRVTQRLAQSLRVGQDEMWMTHAGVIRALLWLQRQSGFKAWMQALLAQPAAETLAFPSDLLPGLRAADWPQDELVFGQVLHWHWPPDS